MASHYDPKKTCRVGTMDEKQFYTESSKANGDWFRSLLAAWEKSGGSLKWGAGGVGLRGPIRGKDTGICFLATAFKDKKDRIELACTTLAKQIGSERCEKLQDELKKVAGDHVLGKSMISIVEPGELPVAKQKKLSKVLRDTLCA